MKIGILGSHGVGKTTLALDLAQQMQRTGLYSVTVLTELARECPYPLGVNQCVEATYWLIARQISRELELQRHSSVVVCDRTSIDALVYTMASGHIDESQCTLAGIAKQWLSSYTLLLWIRADGSVHDDGFRMLDNVFRQKVDQTFAPYLKDLPQLIEVSQAEIMHPASRQLVFARLLQQIGENCCCQLPAFDGSGCAVSSAELVSV